MSSLERMAETMFKPPTLGERAISSSRLSTKPANPLPGFVTRDLFNGYQAPGYIVKGILEPCELAVFFGDSGAMKSFAVIDMAMHIATGNTYAGHRVVHGGVLYIAGEGGEGIKRRLKAWMIRHGIGPDEEQPRIFTATQPADLMFDRGTILATINTAEELIGESVSVVIFDTLATCFGDGDENVTGDMTQAIQGARLCCGDHRAIVFVHHVGHGDKTRERGSYALRAAADRRVLVERPGDGQLVTLTCQKAKDGEAFKPIAFEWRQVELGWFDADGDELTSVILEPTEREPDKSKPTGKNQKAVITLLEKHGPTRRRDLVSMIVDAGGSRTSTQDTIKRMLDSGELIEGFEKLHLREGQP